MVRCAKHSAKNTFGNANSAIVGDLETNVKEKDTETEKVAFFAEESTFGARV